MRFESHIFFLTSVSRDIISSVRPLATAMGFLSSCTTAAAVAFAISPARCTCVEHHDEVLCSTLHTAHNMAAAVTADAHSIAVAEEIDILTISRSSMAAHTCPTISPRENTGMSCTILPACMSTLGLPVRYIGNSSSYTGLMAMGEPSMWTPATSACTARL